MGRPVLRVTQHTGVVYKWCRSLICLAVELYQHPLDVEQVAMDGIQEPSSLQMLRRSAAGSKSCQRIGGGRAKHTYIEMPSSLMIYPMPYPSAATGPKPNRRRAGLPQLEVERIEVFKTLQPWSVKMPGNEPLLVGGGTGSSGDGSRFRHARARGGNTRHRDVCPVQGLWNIP
jgi:hypothetical protein